MVRKSSTPASTVAAPVESAAPVQVESAAPVQVESVQKKSRKSTKKTEVLVSVAADVTPQVENVVLEPVVSEQPVELSESSLTTKMTEFGARLQQVLSLASTLKAEFKVIEKAVSRDIKAAAKASSKKSKRTGNRQPSGFVKPTKISDELANFLGKPLGTEIARTVVSKEINNYIRANSLQDAANGRKINPDAKLTQLLKLSEGEELTYFNLQRFMKHHFVKMSDDATVTASVSASV